MNKFSIAIVLVVALVGLVAANKLHHRRNHCNECGSGSGDEEFEVEPHHGGHHGGHHVGHHDGHHGGHHGGLRHHGRRHQHHDSEGEDFEAGHHGGFGGHQGGFGGHGGKHIHREPIHHGGKGFHHGGNLHRGKHFKRHGQKVPHHKGGAGGAIGGLGAVGGFNRKHDSNLGGVGSHTHLGSSSGASAHKNELLAGEGHFDVDNHRDNHSEDEGIRKHQVLNKDKTIIKDRTTGVNDVDGFRHSDSHSDSNHIGAGVSGLASKNQGGSIHSEKELDHDFGAIGANEHSSESGAGAIGAAGAVGGLQH